MDSALHALTRLTQVLKSMSASVTLVMRPDSSLKMMEHAKLALITTSQPEWNAPSQPVLIFKSSPKREFVKLAEKVNKLIY